MDRQGEGMYVAGGRDSVPLERPLKASLRMAFYTRGCSASSGPQPAFPFRPQHVLRKLGAVDCSTTWPSCSSARWQPRRSKPGC
jgi:hypothetical protein